MWLCDVCNLHQLLILLLFVIANICTWFVVCYCGKAQRQLNSKIFQDTVPNSEKKMGGLCHVESDNIKTNITLLYKVIHIQVTNLTSVYLNHHHGNHWLSSLKSYLSPPSCSYCIKRQRPNQDKKKEVKKCSNVIFFMSSIFSTFCPFCQVI